MVMVLLGVESVYVVVIYTRPNACATHLTSLAQQYTCNPLYLLDKPIIHPFLFFSLAACTRTARRPAGCASRVQTWT